MSQSPIRIAVVGAGVFGRNHLRVIRETPAAELAGVYDADAQRGAAAASEFGCRAFHSLEEVAAGAQAAIVAVPTVSHCEVGVRLMDAGLDVLVEKPIAVNVEEAHALMAQAARRGRVLQAGHLERFNPAVEVARSLITVPLFFEIHRLSVFSPRSLDVDVVSDLMIHDLDILLSMTGAAPREIRAAGINVLSGKADIANVRLAFPGGCIANLTASRVSTERVRKLRFFQPGQYVSVDYAKQECFSISVTPQRQIVPRNWPVTRSEPLKLQLESFLECVATRARPRVDGAAATQALSLAADIQRAISEHGIEVAATLASAPPIAWDASKA
ncbi:MAG: Gfo/Idh/MocA family oxidoreductase [Bryobacteraceae bacterium]|nr:Gfo/Idh/MocA family oxidoreductase [Bryobacteraceae bacterium]